MIRFPKEQVSAGIVHVCCLPHPESLYSRFAGWREGSKWQAISMSLQIAAGPNKFKVPLQVDGFAVGSSCVQSFLQTGREASCHTPCAWNSENDVRRPLRRSSGTIRQSQSSSLPVAIFRQLHLGQATPPMVPLRVYSLTRAADSLTSLFSKHGLGLCSLDGDWPAPGACILRSG